MGVAEIIGGIVAAGNWVFKRQGNGVRLAVTDAHAPNEVVDVGDRFLVGFRGKDYGLSRDQMREKGGTVAEGLVPAHGFLGRGYKG